MDAADRNSAVKSCYPAMRLNDKSACWSGDLEPIQQEVRTLPRS